MILTGRWIGRTRSSGFAAVEYLGIVAAVALLMASLMVLRSHRPSGKPPLRSIPVLTKLLQSQQALLRPPAPRRPPAGPRRPRPPRRPSIRPPAPPPVVIRVPEWILR